MVESPPDTPPAAEVLVVGTPVVVTEEKPRPAPGIYPDMPPHEYHAVDAASASKLKTIDQSAAHLRYELDNPRTTPALIQGDAIHTAILEPAEFDARYTVMPDFGDFRSSRNREARDSWLAGLPKGVHVLTQEQVNIATACKIGALKIAGIRNRLNWPGCQKELSIFWNHPEIAAFCKCRIDGYIPNGPKGPEVFDIKSVECAANDDFQRSVESWGWHIQAAFYLDCLTIQTGEVHENFSFIAVEKGPPFCAKVHRLHPLAIEVGRIQYKKLLAFYEWCKAENFWPGYPEEEDEFLILSNWYLKKNKMLPRS